MAFRIPNMFAPLVNKITGVIVPPWNSFFQQFTNPAQAISDIAVTASPFQIQQNDIGHFLVSGGTVSAIKIIRGKTTITVATNTTNPRLIPISLGDTLEVTYTVLPTIKFIPQWG
jgi:hypothetical protein